MKRIVFVIGFLSLAIGLNAQWSEDSKKNTKYSPDNNLGNTLTKSVKTSDDMMYVSWTADGAGFKTRLQLVDKDGYAMWTEGGIHVSDHKSATWTSDYTLCITPDDCAILTLSDSRNDPTGRSFEPYIYKINKQGEFLWGDDGIKIPYDNFAGFRPRACVTNAGNIVVGFTDYANDGQVVFCKFSPDGDVLWSGLIVRYASIVNFIPSGNDSFILTYYITTGTSAKFYAEKYNGNGEAVWGEPVEIDVTGRISSNNEPYVLSDGEDGALVLYGISISNSEFYVMMQRISPNGDLLMGLEGVKCSDTYEIHTSGRFDIDKERGEIFVFETCYQSPDPRSLRVNKFNFYGETLWDSQGVNFVDKYEYDYMTHGVSHTGDGGVILVYTKGMTGELLAAKIEADGTTEWKDVPISDYQSGKSHVACSSVFNNQVCVFWSDDRSGRDDIGAGEIYGQNVSLEGKIGITGVGIEENVARSSDINVYPNPARDFIVVRCDFGQIGDVEIYDLSGRIVKSLLFQNEVVDIRGIKPGLYVLRISTSMGEVLTEKIYIK